MQRRSYLTQPRKPAIVTLKRLDDYVGLAVKQQLLSLSLINVRLQPWSQGNFLLRESAKILIAYQKPSGKRGVDIAAHWTRMSRRIVLRLGAACELAPGGRY